MAERRLQILTRCGWFKKINVMRHGDKQNNLGRKKAHREALLANLGGQLITNKRIVTTLAKAKALRVYVEPLLTKTKKNSTKEDIMHQHRIVFSYLKDKLAVKELFTVVAPKIADRPGGYTRVIKLGKRVGDNAEMAMIELVDFNEIYGNSIAGSDAATKKTRRGRSKKSTSTEASNTTAITDIQVEDAAVETKVEEHIAIKTAEEKTEE